MEDSSQNEENLGIQNEEDDVEQSLQASSDADGSESESEEDDASSEEVTGEEVNYRQTNGHLRLGKEYETAKEAKDDIFLYSVLNRKDLKLEKSEKTRITAVCNYEGCGWRILVSMHSASRKLMIKRLSEEHRCIDTEKNKMYKIPRIVDAIIDLFRQWPTMKASDIKEHILSTYKVRVSMPHCKEVRRKCRGILREEQSQQFERLWDYVAELRLSNPGSTVELETQSNIFRRMYIMFGAMKEGWRSCRKVLHLDGAFLKWELKGELLSAVARDANDQLYPLAWAIVEVENKKNWSWFIKHLIEDLNLSIGEGLTIISDQQKCIILSISKYLPVAEHRMCARHIWANLKKKCNDDKLKLLFWKAAKCYTEVEFRECLEKIKMIQIVGYNELMKQDARHWCRDFFSTICKCDTVVNNFSESFNALIRDARRKPGVEMLEK